MHLLWYRSSYWVMIKAAQSSKGERCDSTSVAIMKSVCSRLIHLPWDFERPLRYAAGSD